MTNARVACLLGEMFEDSEFRIPYDRLREAGCQVEIIGRRAGVPLHGYRGREVIRTERGIEEVRPEEYGALLIPGGFSPDHRRADPRFVEFVKDFEATGRPIAAVCHGPQLLIAAHLVKGRTLTAWKTVQDDLRQIGADVRDEPVVVDRNWITSRQPDDLHVFADAIVRALGLEAAEGGDEETDEATQRPRRSPSAEQATAMTAAEQKDNED